MYMTDYLLLTLRLSCASTRSLVVAVLKQAKSSWLSSPVQLSALLMLRAPFLGELMMMAGRSAVPDWRIARWKSPAQKESLMVIGLAENL